MWYSIVYSHTLSLNEFNLHTKFSLKWINPRCLFTPVGVYWKHWEGKKRLHPEDKIYSVIVCVLLSHDSWHFQVMFSVPVAGVVRPEDKMIRATTEELDEMFLQPIPHKKLNDTTYRFFCVHVCVCCACMQMDACIAHIVLNVHTSHRSWAVA